MKLPYNASAQLLIRSLQSFPPLKVNKLLIIRQFFTLQSRNIRVEFLSIPYSQIQNEKSSIKTIRIIENKQHHFTHSKTDAILHLNANPRA